MGSESIGCLMCRGLMPPAGGRCKHCGREGERMKHTCHADGCEREVPPKMLMCLDHWRKVPYRIQKKVWAAYVPGQEIRKNPTREYLGVMKEAVDAVALAEGRR